MLKAKGSRLVVSADDTEAAVRAAHDIAECDAADVLLSAESQCAVCLTAVV